MSGGVSSVSRAIDYASYYVEAGVNVAFSASSAIYNGGLNLAKNYSNDYPFIRLLVPQEGEKTRAAFWRGIQLGFVAVSLSVAVIFIVNALFSTVSNFTYKVAVGCVMGGLAGIMQNLHARLSAQGSASADLIQALQDRGQSLNGRVVAVVITENDPAAISENIVSESKSAVSDKPAVSDELAVSVDAASKDHANSDEDASEFEKV